MNERTYVRYRAAGTNQGTRDDLTRDEAEALGRALLEGVLLIPGLATTATCSHD